MTQQTIDVQINLPAETIPDDLMQPVCRAGAADQPEVAWNPPASMGCRNTGIHHVGLHAANPRSQRNSTGMFSAWRSSAGAPPAIQSVRLPF